MPRRRKKDQGGGVPEWVVTYGDMMTLLLCFFILLAAFSELKDEKDYETIMRAIKEHFGYSGGSGQAPTEDLPLTSMVQDLRDMTLHKEKRPNQSNADDPGVDGKETTVKQIREGLQFAVGGPVSFEPGSAELKPQAKEQLARIADLIRGKNNKIEIRGHATGSDLSAGSGQRDMWALSYERARAAMRWLTDEANGIDPRRIRIVGCGTNEPLVGRVYRPAQLAANRRVEIILNETLVEELDAPESDEMADAEMVR
jgi:chemotaxis protein MotB